MHKYSNKLDNLTSFLCYKGQKWFLYFKFENDIKNNEMLYRSRKIY